jgi:hypothetical protein
VRWVTGGASDGFSKATFTVDAFARRQLLDGVDELGFLQGLAPQIAAYEEKSR